MRENRLIYQNVESGKTDIVGKKFDLGLTLIDSLENPSNPEQVKDGINESEKNSENRVITASVDAFNYILKIPSLAKDYIYKTRNRIEQIRDGTINELKENGNNTIGKTTTTEEIANVLYRWSKAE